MEETQTKDQANQVADQKESNERYFRHEQKRLSLEFAVKANHARSLNASELILEAKRIEKYLKS